MVTQIHYRLYDGAITDKALSPRSGNQENVFNQVCKFGLFLKKIDLLEYVLI